MEPAKKFVVFPARERPAEEATGRERERERATESRKIALKFIRIGTKINKYCVIIKRPAVRRTAIIILSKMEILILPSHITSYALRSAAYTMHAVCLPSTTWVWVSHCRRRRRRCSTTRCSCDMCGETRVYFPTHTNPVIFS